jgi:hypothetical protein
MLPRDEEWLFELRLEDKLLLTIVFELVDTTLCFYFILILGSESYRLFSILMPFPNISKSSFHAILSY